jgi:hypothetical protein
VLAKSYCGMPVLYLSVHCSIWIAYFCSIAELITHAPVLLSFTAAASQQNTAAPHFRCTEHALLCRVVAGGGWTLRTLSLRACVQVSDTGIAAMLPLCSQLQSLNISDCPRVGEYGDKALIALGKHCSGLLKLEALGCQHVQGAGLSALAQVKIVEHIFNTSFYRYVMISSVRAVSMAKSSCFTFAQALVWRCTECKLCVSWQQQCCK